MEKVKFFVKRNTKDEKIVHSICRTTESPKFVFPPHLRCPKFHSEGVRKAIESHPFKNRTHVTYVLKGKELTFYINPGNGEFWYKGVPLTKVPSAGISKKPSDDVPQSDEESTDEVQEINEMPVKRLRSAKAAHLSLSFAEENAIQETKASKLNQAKMLDADLNRQNAKMFQRSFEPSSHRLEYSSIGESIWRDVESRPSLVRQHNTSKCSFFQFVFEKRLILIVQKIN